MYQQSCQHGRCMTPVNLFILCVFTLSTGVRSIQHSIDHKQGWSSWGSWTVCTELHGCLSGSRTRSRNCNTGRCYGLQMETEECPTVNCTLTTMFATADILPAPTTSFISQECDTDIKFLISGSQASLLPSLIKTLFAQYMNKLHRGYFNIQLLDGVTENPDDRVTKTCIEPSGLTVRDIRILYRFNRMVKSSLYTSSAPALSDFVRGVVVAVDKKTNELRGIYYSVQSERFGSKHVGYRRWRGQGYQEHLR